MDLLDFGGNKPTTNSNIGMSSSSNKTDNDAPLIFNSRRGGNRTASVKVEPKKDDFDFFKKEPEDNTFKFETGIPMKKEEYGTKNDTFSPYKKDTDKNDFSGLSNNAYNPYHRDIDFTKKEEIPKKDSMDDEFENKPVHSEDDFDDGLEDSRKKSENNEDDFDDGLEEERRKQRR
ncbi:MAG: hypothetical protein MJ252_23630 [archaeon]|nr:hypothetical protein [archaeon]